MNKITLKDIIDAQKSMYLFKKGYTYYPRWLEIGFGVLSRVGLIIIFIGLIKIYLN